MLMSDMEFGRAAAASMVAMAALASGLVAPSTSLATIPVGYFGGHHNQPTSARGEELGGATHINAAV